MRWTGWIFACILLGILSSFTMPTDNDSKFSDRSRTRTSFLKDYLTIRYPKHTFKNYIYVEVKKQELHYVKNDSIIKSYTISTGKKGIGNVKNSFKTPTGLHEIYSKIGDNVPPGGILKGSKFTGQIARITEDETICKEDIVCTRAMRLKGLENGHNKGGNVDTFSRYIYIHGTPDEGLLGTPISHGCIRMANDDVAELFSLIDIHTKVIILNL